MFFMCFMGKFILSIIIYEALQITVTTRFFGFRTRGS